MLTGGDGDDLLAGGPGDDSFHYGGAGDDKLFGGHGNEYSYYGVWLHLYGDRFTFRDTALPPPITNTAPPASLSPSSPRMLHAPLTAVLGRLDGGRWRGRRFDLR